MFLFNKTFKLTLLLIFFIEIISFLGYLFPIVNKFAFFIILLSAVIVSLKNLEYGIWIMLVELFIGSKGYLFYFEQSGLIISIRIALWLIILSVWISKFATDSIKSKKIDLSFLKSDFAIYFYFLFLFIILGIFRGWRINNDLSVIFFDANGWLYFALLFPIYFIFKNKPTGPNNVSIIKNDLLSIFSASILWLCLKTYFLLFIFSHNMAGLRALYRWVRNSGVGEITLIQGGFYRIFFQSHIFILCGFFIFLLYFIYKIKENNSNLKSILKSYDFIILFCVLSVLMSVNLMTFSRSNWLGMFFGFAFLMIFWCFKKEWRNITTAIIVTFLSAIIAMVLIIGIVKFPYPNPLGGFNATDLFSDRASTLSGEAGASSRWSLLPALWNKIKLSPIVGLGFGTTVSYISSDPTVLKTSPTGLYTTYAFEWGWLDIWLKIGIFGLLSYLALLYIIIFKCLKKYRSDNLFSILNLGFIVGLISIIFVNIFSSYFNHPLGIGYLLMTSIMVAKS